jgi:hypothetical protein
MDSGLAHKIECKDRQALSKAIQSDPSFRDIFLDARVKFINEKKDLGMNVSRTRWDMPGGPCPSPAGGSVQAKMKMDENSSLTAQNPLKSQKRGQTLIKRTACVELQLLGLGAAQTCCP